MSSTRTPGGAATGSAATDSGATGPAADAPDGPAPFSEDRTSAGRLPEDPPTLSPLEFARWTWRQLTSMRTALVLLFLLALAAVPGSIIPQTPENPSRVLAYKQSHPGSTPMLERLHLFDVYHSPWFASVYLLLFVSLVGCVVPRSAVHLRAARSRPSLVPRNLLRLPVSETWITDAAPETVLAAARRLLRPAPWRGRRYRLNAVGPDGAAPVAAERGHLRETGNLVFHLALLVMLGGLAWSSLNGYKGTAIVVEGTGFADSHVAYDDFAAGPLVNTGKLPPFSLHLTSFESAFESTPGSDQFGQPTRFLAHVVFRSSPGAPAENRQLWLDHPIKSGGAQVSLQANGYAPIFKVTDASGHVVYDGATVFLPTDGDYTSTGVVKVTGLGTSKTGSPSQLGISGFFLPTASPVSQDSVFPGPTNPQVRITFYVGDLGLTSQTEQSVYTLDTSKMTQLHTSTGQPLTASLAPGASITLPGGHGTVQFLGFRRWINIQVSNAPGTPVVLGAAIAAVLGLCGSLFVRRRRFWVRAVADGPGRTVVETAGLDRARDPDVRLELDTLVAALQVAAPITEDARARQP